ncbi:MAG: hypothetical protein GVY23_02870 [Spirochaetes bacterium]|jgi:hypothetical protein|nr:hypothetical protein [Spirochaetota bacterium]
MKIQILGTGCPKCRLLTSNTEPAVADPGVDDTLLNTGKVLSVDQVKAVIREHAQEGVLS